MKKAPYNYLTLTFGVVLWASFLLPMAQAQSLPPGNFVLFDQGYRNVVATTTYAGGAAISYEAGNGYTGTTTGAFVAGTQNLGAGTATVDIDGYATSAYTSPVSQCNWQGTFPASPSAQLLQLTTMGAHTACTLDPTLFYLITIESNINWLPNGGDSVSNINLQPINNAGSVYPYFAVVANGFQITPTAASSGLFLSGANGFCASAFASSTAPAVATDLGVAGCDVVGYAFVPTPASIQQFQNFATAVQTKIPFSYYNDTATILNGATGSSTQNFQSFSMDFSGTALASSSPLANGILATPFDLLSTTTISAYVPLPLYNFLYGLEVSAIWVSVLFIWYRKIVPTKANI